MLFSDLGNVAQLVFAVHIVIWSVHRSTHASKAPGLSLALLLMSLTLVLAYSAAVVWIRYTRGLVRIPNLPVHWFVTVPREGWPIDPNLLMGLDLVNNFAWLIKNLGIFLVIAKWSRLLSKKRSGLAGAVGLILTLVCGVAICVLNYCFRDETLRRIVIPLFVLELETLVLVGFVSAILVSLKKIGRNLVRKLESNQNRHCSNLFVQINTYFWTFFLLLVSLVAETLGLLIICIGAVANESSGLFNDKMATDILTTLHLVGSTGSYVFIILVIS